MISTSIPSDWEPFFVVIIIAPDEPRAPYKAEAVAPFKTSKDSISSEAISFKDILPYGTPSIINKGLLPLNVKDGELLNSVLLFIFRPATFPVNEVPTSIVFTDVND